MITVFGSINADLIFPVATLPTPGQTLLAAAMTTEPGGKGANQALAAARDGGSVSMSGATGSDALAEIALALLRNSTIDLTHIATIDGQPTGCACICTDPAGRNQIVLSPGANLLARQAEIQLGTTLITQMETDPAETAALIRRAHAAGTRTIHNHAPAAPLDPAALALIDILVVNEDEADWLTRHAAIAPATTLIRTLGAAGVEWQSREGRGHIPASKITPVDTTAAGDCFVGVLAAALDRGADLPTAIARANRAAGLACTRPGSQRSLPTTADIDTRAQHPLTHSP